MGAGSIITITYTIIGDIYPFEEREKVQGWMSGIWGISGILGPLTGGFLVDYVSWHWIFYMNLPFGILSIALIGMFLHEHVEKRGTALAGMVLFFYIESRAPEPMLPLQLFAIREITVVNIAGFLLALYWSPSRFTFLCGFRACTGREQPAQA